MHILIVYAHPRPPERTFSGAVLEQFKRGAEEAGHTCEVADLYREGFNPLMSDRDLQQLDGVPMPDDVLKEQARIERADGLCFIFPIWWFGPPAMFKGWLDRVWSAGWAYTFDEKMSGSLLDARPCTFLMPTGSRPSRMARQGYDKDLDNVWRNGVLGFCGVNPIDIHFLLETDGFNQEPFQKHLEFSYEVGLNFGVEKEPGVASV